MKLLIGKIETKVDKLQDNLTEELKNLKKELIERIVDLEDQVDLHTDKIHKLESNWNTAAFVIGAGAAFIAWVIDSIVKFFSLHK